MTNLVLDIETIRNPDLPDEVRDFRERNIRADARTKDPEKIKAQIAEKKAGLYEKDALDPDYGMICCITAYLPEPDEYIKSYMGNEADLLNRFRNVLMGAYVGNVEVITFNGIAFDIPYILHRYMAQGIVPPNIYSSPFTDVAYLLAHEPYRLQFPRHSLEEYALLYGIPYYADVSGKDVQELWDTHNYDEIRMHCESDCRVTWELYKRAKDYTPVKWRG